MDSENGQGSRDLRHDSLGDAHILSCPAWVSPKTSFGTMSEIEIFRQRGAKIAPMAKLKELWNENGFLLEKTEHSETRVWANFDGQDPKKRWERQAESMTFPRPTCGQIIGEHTPEEIRTCARKQRENR